MGSADALSLAQARKEAEKAAQALFVPETEDEPEATVDPVKEEETASQQASAAQAAELGMVHRLTESGDQPAGLEVRKTQGRKSYRRSLLCLCDTSAFDVTFHQEAWR